MADAYAEKVEKDGSITPKRRFDARDWDYIADYVCEEYERRKRLRDTLEKHWKEIDRQVAMEPERAYKLTSTGQIDPGRMWMSEVELSLQAQALEVLTSDARRFMKPDTGSWFRAHAETTDEYLQRVDFQSLILGDETDVPSKINQDNADKLVEGFIVHQSRQYDFWQRIDKINAESFKYGCGVGRGINQTSDVFIQEARGIRRETQKIPVLVPASVKNLYLDDTTVTMHTAQMLGPAHIWQDTLKFENLAFAAKNGSKEPEDEDGGWMPQNLGKIEPDKDGMVTLLEMEGDIVVPRKTVASMVIRGAVVTIAMGGKRATGKGNRAVVRCRFRKYPFSSYILFPYHHEGAMQVYPTSPLMKGRPIQVLASNAANRLMDSAMLKIAPPIGYDRNDSTFAAQGGPRVGPFAQWPTSDPQAIKAFIEFGGDPSTMASVMAQAISLYAELTGVLPARLGAQTVSHTTAFAKDAELQRGAVRTIDYVNTVGDGAMVKWCDMSYRMARDNIPSTGVSYYIDAYGGYVNVKKDQLPENAIYDWLGAGGPQERTQQQQAKLASLSFALKMDQVGQALGKPPRIDLDAAITEVLREGGWTDIDSIVAQAAPAGAPALPGPGPGPAVAAIQNLAAPPPGA